MIKPSVAYVLCRIEDDASLSPISEHKDVADGVAAGKHQVEVEDFDFGYGLFADGVRVAFFAETNRLSGVGTQERAAWRHPQHRRPLRPRH